MSSADLASALQAAQVQPVQAPPAVPAQPPAQIKEDPDAPRKDAKGDKLAVGDTVQLLAPNGRVVGTAQVASVTTGTVLCRRTQGALEKGGGKVTDPAQRMAANKVSMCALLYVVCGVFAHLHVLLNAAQAGLCWAT